MGTADPEVRALAQRIHGLFKPGHDLVFLVEALAVTAAGIIWQANPDWRKRLREDIIKAIDFEIAQADQRLADKSKN